MSGIYKHTHYPHPLPRLILILLIIIIITIIISNYTYMYQCLIICHVQAITSAENMQAITCTPSPVQVAPADAVAGRWLIPSNEPTLIEV